MWYPEGVIFRHIAFVCGNSEEIAIIDDQAQIRVFSLVTQQFWFVTTAHPLLSLIRFWCSDRPATVQLESVPASAYSLPDGSCLLVQLSTGFRVFHWSTFGSTDGIAVAHLNAPHQSDGQVLTSFGNRANVHLVNYMPSTHQCSSMALSITSRATEFSFREKQTVSSNEKPHFSSTVNNSLIDCHADVWTRYPVIPAICRGTVDARSRVTRSIDFVTPCSHSKFPKYFKEMVSNFEKRTRKPTEDQLGKIIVRAMSHEDFLRQSSLCLSVPRLGEWIVEILCLIPIHIAVARDNRFVPLKDGVWSAEFERSLAGATVDHIIDGLSCGWYESIFQSYMATKVRKTTQSIIVFFLRCNFCLASQSSFFYG